ncbi:MULTISPECIES: sugar kinase [unclassified Cryobacterium]|uniref:sugar kinase n=1 Tax=unclassified Cryobacterium TaxID=2649013 RepID=UPI0018E0C2ED|nr:MULTISPECIES: sugar kinase [unclassified Cryobacterium]
MTRDIDVVTLGETMALIKANATGSLAHQSALGLSVGGAESNCAIALRRLGTSVTWIGRVGADSLGERVLRELRAEGVVVHGIIDPIAPTGLMIKERRTADSIKVVYYRSGSAGSRLSPSDVDTVAISSAKILHVTGITAGLSASAADAVDFAVSCAKEAGTLVSFDYNYRSALWAPPAAAAAFRRLTEQADLVFAGDDEAALVVGPGTPRDQASALAELGPRHAVIKLGARGSVALIHGEYFEQPAIPVRAVDTVGAGDAFVAGYLSDLLRGVTPEERLLTAATVGAFACTVEGDWEGNPVRDELGLLHAVENVRR